MAHKITAKQQHVVDRKRRAMLICAGAGVMSLILGARLYDLQVIKAGKFRLLAEKNRIDLHLIAPPRGRIVDRNNVVLAQNIPDYQIRIIPEKAGSLPRIIRLLRQYITISDAEEKRIMGDFKRQAAFIPILAKDDLSWPEFAKINAHIFQLPGVEPMAEPIRYYPAGVAFFPVVGYVGLVSPGELRANRRDPLLQLPHFRTGKAGVEKIKERNLRGRAGRRQVEVNWLGRIIRELERVEPIEGAKITLTIDAHIQNYAYQRLAGHSASLCVLDIATGEILSLVSTPATDPNPFIRGWESSLWRQVLANPKQPLMNKPLSGLYPPASTFKIITALAGLQYGIVRDSDIVTCKGALAFGDRKFHCWKRNGHGAVNLHNAIKRSCDVYFYKLAEKLGIEKLAHTAKALGVGKYPDSGMEEEKKGIMPDPKWKYAHLGDKWQKGETLITAIGQGAVTMTPLQMTLMVARIANDGVFVAPHLVQKIAQKSITPQKPPKRVAIARRHFATIRQAMRDVVNAPGGTAYASRLGITDWELAGKTGTAQLQKIDARQRELPKTALADIPWQERDHSLFVGYAPHHAPRYAICVVVEHGGAGSIAAAPAARDVMRVVYARREKAKIRQG